MSPPTSSPISPVSDGRAGPACGCSSPASPRGARMDGRTDGRRCCGIAQCVCTEGCCAAPCPLPCLPGCPCPLPAPARGTGPEHLTPGYPHGTGGPHAMREEQPQCGALPPRACFFFCWFSFQMLSGFGVCLPSVSFPVPITPHPPHPISQISAAKLRLLIQMKGHR